MITISSERGILLLGSSLQHVSNRISSWFGAE
jgi:hypothetical protein